MDKGSNKDKDLIERYLAGDKKALVELVRKWHKVFCDKAFWVLHDKALSKDVAQESWLTIINKLHALKDPNSFKGWAFRIVYTKSIDVYKRRNKELKQLKDLERVVPVESGEKNTNSELKLKLLKGIQDLEKSKSGVPPIFRTGLV